MNPDLGVPSHLDRPKLWFWAFYNNRQRGQIFVSVAIKIRGIIGLNHRWKVHEGSVREQPPRSNASELLCHPFYSAGTNLPCVYCVYMPVGEWY